MYENNKRRKKTKYIVNNFILFFSLVWENENKSRRRGFSFLITSQAKSVSIVKNTQIRFLKCNRDQRTGLGLPGPTISSHSANEAIQEHGKLLPFCFHCWFLLFFLSADSSFSASLPWPAVRCIANDDGDGGAKKKRKNRNKSEINFLSNLLAFFCLLDDNLTIRCCQPELTSDERRFERFQLWHLKIAGLWASSKAFCRYWPV